MNKILIVRIAEGLGNQLFMYANAYSLSKRFNYKLYIDNESGFFKNKGRSRIYNLDFFEIPEEICSNHLKFNNYFKDVKRKLLKFNNKFTSNKNFLIEEVDQYKQTKYNEVLSLRSPKIFIEGHFETELYFKDFHKDLRKILKVKNDLIDNNNSYIDKIKQTNSVSIHLRKNRYTEDLRSQKTNDYKNDELFEKNLLNYVHNSINYLDKKLDNPHYFIWSNDLSSFKQSFLDQKKFTFIENDNLATDFYLFSLCKNFIVGPSTFHWWGAWLNENSNKICIRPSNINPSNNYDFWPKNWLSI